MMLTDMIPDTEVKLVLRSKRAMPGKALSKQVRSLLGIEGDAVPMSVWYLDTPAQKLRREGWSLRYRQRPESGLELTYKKRYSEPDYRAMLLTPAAQRFAADFTPEIDLGYAKTTCSLSNERVFEPEGGKLTALKARRLAIVNCPRVLNDWNGENKGFARLCTATLFGPVAADTYTGSFEGQKLKFEIWPLDGYFCELSFDIPSDKSAEMRARVTGVLEAHGLLKKPDTLKTDAMLDFYARPKK